jgi:hypothetical protein
MPRTVDVVALKKASIAEINYAMNRYSHFAAGLDYLFQRWIAQMTAVEIHAIWERYVETRLVAALNHAPQHFLKDQNIKGVSRISSGFAYYIVRGGGRFFDFRSTAELVRKANGWLGKAENPFRSLPAAEYIDCLAAIRNYVVHRSTASVTAYKRHLESVYGISAAPAPEEFLHAKDNRAGSPARYESRLHGIAAVVVNAIKQT